MPRVIWKMDDKLYDYKSYVTAAGIENHLVIPKVTRDHLDKKITCEATNTNLAPPLSTTLNIELMCKTTFHIILDF